MDEGEGFKLHALCHSSGVHVGLHFEYRVLGSGFATRGLGSSNLEISLSPSVKQNMQEL